MQLKTFATVGIVWLGGFALLAAGCGGNDEATNAPTTAAIAMAKAAQKAGLTEPELVTIAGDIVVTQQQEIDRILDWREQWYGSRTVEPMNADTLGLSDDEMGMSHHTEGEIAHADDVDAAFAEAMIPHHEGAIAMAELAGERAQHDEIKNLAGAITSAQAREIRTLKKHAKGMHP